MSPKLPKYVFTNSGLVALSAFPLLLSALGLYGMLISGLGEITVGAHLFIGGACLIPAVSVIVVLSWIERKRNRKTDLRRNKKRRIREYSKTAPINNGPTPLASYPPADSGPKDITLFPGVTVKAGENPFRPVTDQAIDETLIKLAQARSRLKRKA